MNDVTVALANLADIADVLPLLAVQLDEHGMKVSRETLSGALREIVMNPDRGRVVVARRDGHSVGFAVMPFTWTVEHGGQCAWLDELYVVPELRARGIGTRLLLAAIEAVRSAGCVAIDLEVDAAHTRVESLYLRNGFHALPRKRFSRKL